jgi:hypothetical protein
MNRHGYGAGANGQHSSGRNNFSIATDKYDKYVCVVYLEDGLLLS